MHDIGFDHFHPSEEERKHLSETIWDADNVELTTVGVDIGSSTSHLMFAHVHLQRLSTGLSSRFVVANREILWRSPILLTPYRDDETIDAGQLDVMVEQSFDAAKIARQDIDSGAVILTGEALKRKNARAIAELFAKDSGKFVCASAGHHMESAMAANGSGAIELSRRRKKTILNIDIGGGTTKFALIKNGELLGTWAIAIGGRLLVIDDEGRISRAEGPIRTLAASLGFELEIGQPLADDHRKTILNAMSRILMDQARMSEPAGVAHDLMVTPFFHGADEPDVVTFSGGVSEFLFKRETGDFGDLGAGLAHRISYTLADGELAVPVWDPGQGIRATVIGASQHSVQISGNTILISEQSLLPVQNIPITNCRFDLGDDIDVDVDAITDEVLRALSNQDLGDGEPMIAISFSWQGDPLHARLHGVGAGIARAVPKTIASGAIVLLVDGDVGMNLGRIFRDEIHPGCRIISIDGIQLRDFDYVDIGQVRQPANVVPVIIKSLLF